MDSEISIRNKYVLTMLPMSMIYVYIKEAVSELNERVSCVVRKSCEQIKVDSRYAFELFWT